MVLFLNPLAKLASVQGNNSARSKIRIYAAITMPSIGANVSETDEVVLWFAAKSVEPHS